MLYFTTHYTVAQPAEKCKRRVRAVKAQSPSLRSAASAYRFFENSSIIFSVLYPPVSSHFQLLSKTWSTTTLCLSQMDNVSELVGRNLPPVTQTPPNI